jgi:aspartate/methionine/tyrosine aminotransferase
VIISLAARAADVGEYWFSRKLDEVRRLEASGVKVLQLGIGSPDLMPPPEAIDAASRALAEPGSHGYAPYRGTPELRRALAAWYARTHGAELDPASEVLPLLGSKEGILHVSLAFLDPGDAVLVPDPGYPAYAAAARLAGARPIPYDLTAVRGWAPDLRALAGARGQGVKLLWVNYPHMPTGRRADRALLDELAAFAAREGVLVCNDNPYGLVLNPEPLSLLASPGARDACLELTSLSKAFHLAGWRVGALLGAAPYVDAVLRVKSNADSGLFIAVQRGAIAALEAPDAWREAQQVVYRARRRAAERLLERLGFTWDPEQVGMFLWGRASDTVTDVSALTERLLRERGVFLTPGEVFGANGRRFLRVSLCAREETLEEAAARVAAP